MFLHVNTAGTVLRIVDSTITATGRYLDHRLAFRCPFLQQATVSPARLALSLGSCIMGTRSSLMLSRKGRIVQNRCYEDKWRECDNKNLRFHDRKRNTARLQRRLLCKFQWGCRNGWARGLHSNASEIQDQATMQGCGFIKAGITHWGHPATNAICLYDLQLLSLTREPKRRAACEVSIDAWRETRGQGRIESLLARAWSTKFEPLTRPPNTSTSDARDSVYGLVTTPSTEFHVI